MNYTEKTSINQVKQLLDILYPNDNYWGINDFSTDYAWSLRIKVDNDLPSLGDLVEALNKCEIWIDFVTIHNMYDHLSITISNMEVGYDLDELLTE